MFSYSMNVSLDGFVDHDRFTPDPVLFRHWTDHVRGLYGSLCGRHIYALTSYWETDDPDWTSDQHDFARAWRAQPKWVVSRTLTAAGPNATLLRENIEARLRDIKATHDGEIAICGTVLAQSAAAWGLIDEYRLYYHPVVLGAGKPFFAGPCPRLRVTASDRIGEAVRVTCVPA